MTAELFLILFPMLAGFAFSAALNEASGLITAEPIGFDLFIRADRQAWRALPYLMFAGPMILVRMARAQAGQAGWLAPAPLVRLGLALVWAPASGHLLLRVAAWASSLAPGGALMMSGG